VSPDSCGDLSPRNGDLINRPAGRIFTHAIIQASRFVIKFIRSITKTTPGIRDGEHRYTNDAL